MTFITSIFNRIVMHRLRRKIEKLAPFTRDYRNCPQVVSPFTCYRAKPNYKSASLNTDSNGYRISRSRGNGIVASDAWSNYSDRCLMLGGSTAFGIGAQNDGETISSWLNRKTGLFYANLGIVGATSTQEMVAAIPFLHDAKSIIIVTGVNNLALTYLNGRQQQLYGHIFNAGDYSSDNKEDTSNHESYEGYGDGYDDLEEYAMRWQMHDIGIILKLTDVNSKVMLCIQPYASSAHRERNEYEEQALEVCRGIRSVNADKKFTSLHRMLEERYANYAKSLTISVNQMYNLPILNLNDVKYYGWSFYDSVHLTSTGYEIIADEILSYSKC